MVLIIDAAPVPRPKKERVLKLEVEPLVKSVVMNGEADVDKAVNGKMEVGNDVVNGEVDKATPLSPDQSLQSSTSQTTDEK